MLFASYFRLLFVRLFFFYLSGFQFQFIWPNDAKWRHITWTTNALCGIHPRAIPQWGLLDVISNMCSEITLLRLLPSLLGVNALTYILLLTLLLLIMIWTNDLRKYWNIISYSFPTELYLSSIFPEYCFLVVAIMHRGSQKSIRNMIYLMTIIFGDQSMTQPN